MLVCKNSSKSTFRFLYPEAFGDYLEAQTPRGIGIANSRTKARGTRRRAHEKTNRVAPMHAICI